MFEGFTEELLVVGDKTVFVRHAGSGAAVLLLHGHPRTSSTWYAVAPALVARGFTVVCPDLIGYGRSGKPTTTADHAPYSKRAAAAAMVELMRQLGHDTFCVAGHDRGSYVALRLTLDSPERVHRLVLMESIPITEHLENITPEFATAWWHWFFFAQANIPERVINADPDAWYKGTPEQLGPENYDEFRTATRDPEVVFGMLEDYRAGLGIDRAHEAADRAARNLVRCPLLVLWASRDDLEKLHGDPLQIWARWAMQVTGYAIDSGHHIAEDAPGELTDALARFLGAPEAIS